MTHFMEVLIVQGNCSHCVLVTQAVTITSFLEHMIPAAVLKVKLSFYICINEANEHFTCLFKKIQIKAVDLINIYIILIACLG